MKPTRLRSAGAGNCPGGDSARLDFQRNVSGAQWAQTSNAPAGFGSSFSASLNICQACTQGLAHSVCHSPRWRHRAPAGENDWQPGPEHRLFAVAQLGCAGWFSALHNWRWCWTTFFFIPIPQSGRGIHCLFFIPSAARNPYLNWFASPPR